MTSTPLPTSLQDATGPALQAVPIRLNPSGAPATPSLLGEGATWSAARAQLLWTDIQNARLWGFEPGNLRVSAWPLPERLGSFALTPDPNRLLAAFEHHLAWLDLATGRCQALLHFEDGLATRSNDGRCDRAGNFVFGTVDELRRGQPAGSWYRYTAGGTLQRLSLPPVYIPNGLAFSANGKRLYFCDSLERAVRCADYDAATGAVHNVQVFAHLAEGLGEPDGATVDAEDHYWSAHWGASQVQRYTPAGQAIERVTLSASQPTCLAFGGEALQTLFITTARQGLGAAVLAAQPDAGLVFSLQTLWRGLPEPLFGGA